MNDGKHESRFPVLNLTTRGYLAIPSAIESLDKDQEVWSVHNKDELPAERKAV